LEKYKVHQLKQQNHQLEQEWQIQDATEQAAASAQAAQTYHKLTRDNTRLLVSQLDSIDDQIHQVKREARRQSSEIQDLRNTCIMWGGLTALICSLGVTLILQPARPPIPPQQSYQQVQP
jgi:ATP-dependent 26S proteasome regulatory subunit